MNPFQFLKQLGQLPNTQGDGFRVIRSYTPTALNVSGATRAVTNSVDRVIFDADNESVILNFTVPEDYDETANELKVSLYCEYISGTSLDVDLDVVTRARAGAALADITSSLADPAAYTLDAAADNGWKEFTLSGVQFLPGDVLAIEIDAQETGSGIVHVLGAQVQYKSTLVFNDPANR